jgi:tetratricopeptide (TPR) repeat protein
MSSHAARARTLLHLRRYPEAAAAARDGLRSDPTDGVLLTILTAALLDGDELRDGLRTSEQAVAALPDSADARRLHGWALHRLHRCRRGVQVLRGAVELAPSDPACHRALADCLMAVGATSGQMIVRRTSKARRLREADAHVSAAERLDPSSAASHLARANLCRARGDRAAAREAVLRALAIDPNDARAHLILGLIAHRNRDARAAGGHYVEAARLNPRSSVALAQLRRLRPEGYLIVALFIAVFPVTTLLSHLSKGLRPPLAAATAAVFWAALLYIGVLQPRRSTRHRLPSEAHRILELDRQLGAKGKKERPVVVVILLGLFLTACLFIMSAPPSPSGSTRLSHEQELFRIGSDSCTPLLGVRIDVGGVGTRSCMRSDLSEVRTRTVYCEDGSAMLTAGSGDSLVHGRVGDTWQPGPAPAC